MSVEVLIDTANNIGNEPDMFHPDYGWIRKDGKTTEAGLEYFRDQLEKVSPYTRSGNC